MILDFPVYRALQAFIDKKPLSFHMPGHKMGRLIPPQISEQLLSFDLTELDGLDNLHDPHGTLLLAQQLLAKAVGAKQSFFLVNGATVGILAAILSTVNPGDKILVHRDCHASVTHAMQLSGAIPIYMTTSLLEGFLISDALDLSDVSHFLASNPDAKAMIITYPTYYGICCDLPQIAQKCAQHNMVLIVDEAHGAHFPYFTESSSKNPLPQSACQIPGCDIVIQSAHKTLPAVTGTAYLHVKGDRVCIEKISELLKMLQTSSPSYISMMMADFARHFMQTQGQPLLTCIVDFCNTLRDDFDPHLLSNHHIRGLLDPTRLTFNVFSITTTGFAFHDWLVEKYRIVPEMRDICNVLFICTVADDGSSFHLLTKAFQEFLQTLPVTEDSTSKYTKQQIASLMLASIVHTSILTPKEAFEADFKIVSLEEAVSRACKYPIIPYPPGVPLLMPGEYISKEKCDLIQELRKVNVRITGLKNKDQIAVVS